MTMMNFRRNSEPPKIDPKMPMPKASNVPAPQPRPAATPTVMPMYDEEVLRVAQRDYDNRQMIQRLEAERDEWRRKYLTEKAERERIQGVLEQETAAHEQAVTRLCADRDAKIEKLERARDDYRVKLKEFETEFAVGGNNLLDLANGIAKTMHRLLDKIRAERDAPDVAGAAGLAAIANALDDDPEFREVDELPRIVTAGPRNEEGRGEK